MSSPQQACPQQHSTDEHAEFLVDSARYGDKEDVASALERGTPADARDGQARTALHMAAANGHLDIVRLLLSAGASTDVRNADGSTPLHWAALNGQLAVVRALLDAGASAAALNDAGRTPVDEALSRDHTDILEAITSSTSGTSAGADCIDVEFVEEGADDALGVAGSSGACCPGASAVEGDDVGAEDDLQADMQAALNAVDRAHAGGSSSGGGVDAGSSGAGGGSGSSELTDAAARLTV